MLAQQPPEVRELFRDALVLALLDGEKARVIGTREDDGRTWLTVEMVAGEGFEILRPAISEELEAEVMAQIRTIARGESEDDES